MHWLQQLTTIDHPDLQVRQRGRLLVIVLMAIIALLICFTPINIISYPGSFVAYSVPLTLLLEIGLLLLARRGAVTLSGWLFVLLTILSVLGTIMSSTTGDPSGALSFFILCIITAGVVLPPRHIWGVIAICVVSCGIALSTRPDLSHNTALQISVFSIILLLIVGGVISYLGASATHKAIAEALANAEQASAAQQRAELQAQEMLQQATTLRETEQQLQDLVSTLETPTVPLMDGVLLATLIGSIDSRRAIKLTERLLQDVATQRIRFLVLDIAGVALIDTAVAKTLTQVVQAVRLLGCQVALTGVGPNIAITLTQLGIDLHGIQTARSPQQILESLAQGVILERNKS